MVIDFIKEEGKKFEFDKTELKNLIETFANISKKLEVLETAVNTRFENLKKFLLDYITLGNEFAVGTLKAALEKV